MSDPYRRQVQHVADHLAFRLPPSAFRLLPLLMLACLGVVIWGIVSALT